MRRFIFSSAGSLFVAASVLFLMGCGQNQTGQGKSVEGTWKLSGNNPPQTYVVISQHTVADYERPPGTACYAKEIMAVTERDGEMYKLAAKDGKNTTAVRLVADGTQLTLQTKGHKPLFFERTNVDPSMLKGCSE